MAADKRWRLICYDIREPARWRKVYKIIRGAGTHVQYSIFRCRLDDRELEKLRWELSRVMAKEDAFLVVDLCPRCAAKRDLAQPRRWLGRGPATFRIIGGEPAPVATTGSADAAQAPVGVGSTSTSAAPKPRRSRRKADL
jgi:CRISPR-associated protein Cas2